MIELLKFYYNMHDVRIIEEKEKETSFLFQEQKYLLTEYLRSESEFQDLLSLNQELINKGFPTSIFILNNQNSYFNFYKEKKYVLLKLSVPLDKEYNVLDMIDFANKLVVSSKKSILIRNRWGELWSSKIDYF